MRSLVITWLTLGYCLLSAEVEEVVIYRSASRIQASSNQLSLPLFPHTAGAQIWLSEDSFDGGFLTFPYGSFIAISREPQYLSVSGFYPHPQATLLAYPEGNYQFGLRRTEGGFLEFSYQASGGIPDFQGPRITNYLDLQSIDPGQPFSISWEPPTNLAKNSRVELEIVSILEDGRPLTVYRISAASPDAVNPAAGFATIPEGTLENGGRYQLQLRFSRPEGVVTGTSPVENAALYTVIRSETQVDLGLASDPSLNPEFSWEVAFDILWNTSGRYFLRPSEQYPRSKDIRILFNPKDWAQVPVGQVMSHGPVDSGFKNATGLFEIYDPEEGTSIAIQSQSIAYPAVGPYSVTYRGKVYPWSPEAAPDSVNTLLPHPEAELDPEGRLRRISWQYRAAETGQIVENESLGALLSQDLRITDLNGVIILEFEGMPYNQRDVVFNESTQIDWEQVESLSVRTKFAGGLAILARYYLVHLERPSMVYFNSAVPYDDWLQVDWFGWLKELQWPWVWHEQHGYLFLAGEGDGATVYFDHRLGWIYTAPTFYPYLYSYSHDEWLYYNIATKIPNRWFYRYGSETGWVSEPEINTF